MDSFAPEQCHGPLLGAARRELARREGQDFASWRKAAEAKLRELVGWMPERVPLAVRVEEEHDHPEFRERRLIFSAEANAQVPCHLLLPHGKGPFPVIICLQGHSTGMHISLGRPRYEGDEKSIAGGRDFALQAVRRGYAALALEQRGFGERKDGRAPDKRCSHASMTALLLGRTMIGERVWDVLQALNRSYRHESQWRGTK